MKKNKGFTLIELLVVIAIIGILSSVVLASLNGARTKAKVAAVQSTMSSMRAQAEIGVINGKYINNICTATTSGGLDTLLKSLTKVSAKTTSVGCGQDAAEGVTPNRWAAEVQIDGKWYCADSSGFSGPVANSTLSLTNRIITGAFTAGGVSVTPNYSVPVAGLVCD